MNSNRSNVQRLVLAVTGASGAIYAVRLLKALLETGVDVELVASDFGRRLLVEECALNLKTDAIPEWLDQRYGNSERPGRVQIHRFGDLGSRVASGSVKVDGMAVVPCSMKSLAGMANGYSSTLIERAADVTLKERRPLVVVPRETPLNVIQLENMTRLARAGAHIVPAMPAFYQAPASIEDLADFIAGRVLSLFDLPHALYPPWEG